MVKKVKSRSSEPEKIIEAASQVPVFSWNLKQGKLDLEDGISLHESINFSCKSLEEFKCVAKKELFDNLNGCFDIDALKESTENQINKNKVNERERIVKILEKFDKKRKEEQSRKDGVELIQSLQEINDQQNAELANIKNKTLVLEKEQADLKKQRKFLAMLTSSEIWDALLLMSEEEAPWVSLNVGGVSYEIKKGEKYENENGELKIKKVIEEKMLDFDVFDDDYVKFVLGFILRPFDIEHDKGTIKYYVYSIIDCIKNTDIVQEIGELYEKKKEVEEKMDQLGKNLELSKEIIGKIYEIKNAVSSDEGNLSFKNISEFKKSAFLEVLENKKWNDEGLSKEDEENIDNFINLLEKSGKSSFEDLFKSNELTLEDKEEVDEDSFFKICDFLGVDYKSEKLKEVIRDMKKLIRDMNNDFIGKKDLEPDDLERYVNSIYNNGIKGVTKNKSYLEEWEYIVDKAGGHNNAKFRLKNIISKRRGGRIKGKDDGDLYTHFKNFCRKTQSTSIDARRETINSYFKELFGFEVAENKTEETDSDKTLMKNMLNALVAKINEDRKNRYKLVDDIKTEWLGKKQFEESIVENIDNKLRQRLSAYFKDFNGEKYAENIDNLKEKLDGLRLRKDTMDEYEKLEEEIEEIEDNEDFLKLQNIGEVLKRYEESDVVNPSEIDKDYNSLKQLLKLKKLFKCEDLTLGEKFDYSNIILKSIEDNKDYKIKSKRGEHDEILVSILGKESVSRKCKVQEVETDESIDDDNENRKKEKELLDKLQSSEDKFESFIDELKNLSGFNDSEVELNRLEKKRTPLLRSLDSEKNEQKKLKILKELFPKSENMRLKDLNHKLDKVKNNLKKYKDNTKLKILKELFPKSVNDEQEFRRLKELFPESVVSYIDACISKNELSFGNSLCAINYKTGVFDFSVIKAGILGKAVEEGKITDVLEYLGFKFGEGVDKGEIDNEVENRLTDVSSTIGCIIQGYRQDNVGCFSDDYLTLGEGSVKLFGNYVRSEGNGSKFTIGYKTDKFRFDGKIKDGKFVIERYFSKNKDGEETRHDSHMDYINRG